MLQLLFQPQYLYIFDRQLNCVLDTILKFESLQEDWLSFSERQGYKKELPKINTSISVETKNQNDELLLITDKSLEKITQLYGFDYKLLGYTSPQLSTND